MIVNPLLSLRTFNNSDSVTNNIQTAAPKKGTSLTISSFLRKHNHALFEKLDRLIIKQVPFADCGLNEAEICTLQRANILISADQIPSYKKFSCAITDHTTNTTATNRDAQYIFNPSSHFTQISDIPKEAKERLVSNQIDLAFDTKSKHNIWVKDWLTNAWWPYSLPRNLYDLALAISNGSINLENISNKKINLLASASILIPQDHIEKRATIIAKQQDLYSKQGSILLNDLLNHHIRKALANYLENLEMEGFLRLGDYQCAQRYWAHNEIINRYTQSQLAGYISEIVKQQWLPAFSYYVSYGHGSSLKKHLDRSQASLSMSLLVDYRNENQLAEDSWPIYVEKSPGSDTYHEYLIGLGNATLFEGNEYVHYRLPIPNDHNSRSMLFHFVKNDFEGKIL